MALLIAVQSGVLDKLPLDAVAAFRAGLATALDTEAPEILETIATADRLDAPTRERLVAAITRFAASLSDSPPAHQDSPEHTKTS